MGRPLAGWKLRERNGQQNVWFTFEGKQVERATGESDLERAAKAGARIYAEITSGKGRTKKRNHLARQGTTGTSIDDVAKDWLNRQKARLDPMTVSTYSVYFDRRDDGLVAFFESFEAITPATIKEYIDDRLLRVRYQTVKHELSVLRQVIEFARDEGIVSDPPEVPRFSVKKHGRGKPCKMRKRSAAPELSPQEVDAIISLLPVWSRKYQGTGRWPIRARFVVGYETSLRPTLLDALSVPEHYNRGSKVLRVPSDDDKIRFGRTVPLSKRARDALDEVISKKGNVFGHHDYREVLRKAAKEVLGEDDPRWQIFNGAHLRSARITHALERTGNLPGVQFLAGHKRSSTTAIYVKPSERAAKAVLEAMGAL